MKRTRSRHRNGIVLYMAWQKKRDSQSVNDKMHSRKKTLRKSAFRVFIEFSSSSSSSELNVEKTLFFRCCVLKSQNAIAVHLRALVCVAFCKNQVKMYFCSSGIIIKIWKKKLNPTQGLVSENCISSCNSLILLWAQHKINIRKDQWQAELHNEFREASESILVITLRHETVCFFLFGWFRKFSLLIYK